MDAVEHLRPADGELLGGAVRGQSRLAWSAEAIERVRCWALEAVALAYALGLFAEIWSSRLAGRALRRTRLAQQPLRLKHQLRGE